MLLCLPTVCGHELWTELKVSIDGLNCQVGSGICSHYVNTLGLSFEDTESRLKEIIKRQE